jgi:SAM-dependent methyltransferase
MTGPHDVPPAAASFEADYYAAVYPNYAAQNPPKKMRFYRRLVERAARGVASPRVLDVGCAFGTFLGSLPSTWSRWGTDVSQHAIAKATAMVPGATFATYDGLHLPFAGPFDVITAFDVLEHVPHVEALLAELAGGLAPGGALVAVVPVYDGPTGPIIRALDRDATHVHTRARGFWRASLGRYLQVEHWEGIYRYLLPRGYYLHLTSRVLRHWTPAIALVARKAV